MDVNEPNRNITVFALSFFLSTSLETFWDWTLELFYDFLFHFCFSKYLFTINENTRQTAIKRQPKLSNFLSKLQAPSVHLFPCQFFSSYLRVFHFLPFGT